MIIEKITSMMKVCKVNPTEILRREGEKTANGVSNVIITAKNLGAAAAQRIANNISKDITSIGQATINTAKMGIKYGAPLAFAYGMKQGYNSLHDKEQNNKQSDVDDSLAGLQKEASKATNAIKDSYEKMLQEYRDDRSHADDMHAITQNKVDKAPTLIVGAEVITKVTGYPEVGATIAAAVDTAITVVPKQTSLLAHNIAKKFGYAVGSSILDAKTAGEKSDDYHGSNSGELI